MKMFKDLKEDMNKSITKIYEYTVVERYEKLFQKQKSGGNQYDWQTLSQIN